MRTLLLFMLLCGMAHAQQQDNAMWNVLQFKGEANLKFYSEKRKYFAQYEYCGIGVCYTIEGPAKDRDIKPLIAASFLFLAYIDNDEGQMTWFPRSPMAFAVDNIATREHVLQQWRPKHCDSPEPANIVICTLKHLVSKHQLTYYFVRYDEGLRNTGVESWDKYLTIAQYIKHEKKLAKHLGKQ
ncbi:MAG: hypothetical protein HRT35_03935 [Algicola sp.]|nr:hypothetical protein [Algicola sp.]